MLTRLEMKILNLVYDFSCKFITIPFCWKSDRMALESRPRVLYDIPIRLLVLLALVLKTSIMLQTNDINGLILGGLFVLGCVSDVVFQINIGFTKLNSLSLPIKFYTCIRRGVRNHLIL